MYAVMLECRTGTTQLVGNAWEYCYHTITWCVEETELDARDTAMRLRNASPREIRKAYVRPYGERFW